MAVVSWVMLLAFILWFAILVAADLSLRQLVSAALELDALGKKIPSGAFRFYERMKWFEENARSFPDGMQHRIGRIIFLRRFLNVLGLAMVVAYILGMLFRPLP
jgi:hypothetical protein